MKSRMGLEESAEEAELNLKPGELLRGVKDLQDVARDEVKLGIFSCEEGFLNLNGDRFLGLEEDDEEKICHQRSTVYAFNGTTASLSGIESE